MSKFNKYYKKVDEIARKEFKQYRDAQAELKAAKEVVDNYPEYHVGMSRDRNTPQYTLKVALAKANLDIAKEEMRKAQMNLGSHVKEFANIREELAADIESSYAADPAKLDASTVELLKSGILKTNDYKSIMDKAIQAENLTMMRIISKYVSEAAEEEGKRYGESSPNAIALRNIAYSAKDIDGSEYLKAFDAMTDVYSRATRNDAMMNYWEQTFTDDAIAEM